MYGKKKKRSRSPLKGRPLHDPGQSVAEEFAHLVNDRMLTWLLAPVFALAFAVAEWWRWYRDSPYNPVLYTAIALVVILASALRLIALVRNARSLKLGRDGERVVGQFLDEMRMSGHFVLHDIVAEEFNIDHVVIGKHGIYTVETKTISLPSSTGGKVSCQGETLLLNGRALGRDPIPQCKGQAAWLKRMLKESTGRDFRVQPVVVFPGWFVERDCKEVAGVWVLEPKALPKFIEHVPRMLEESDVRLAAYHLRRYIRAAE